MNGFYPLATELVPSMSFWEVFLFGMTGVLLIVVTLIGGVVSRGIAKMVNRTKKTEGQAEDAPDEVPISITDILQDQRYYHTTMKSMDDTW